MKCPHCSVVIHKSMQSVVVAQYGEARTTDGKLLARAIRWYAHHQQCPQCGQTIIYLSAYDPSNGSSTPEALIHPATSERPVPADVPDPYRQDFIEANRVLSISAKASAALSRRCLQAILRDQAKTKAKDLFDQIEEVIDSGKLPSHIAEDLHAVRSIGNIAAHTQKSVATGEIIDVEPGEAEWNLDVLDLLFDFYFVQPAISARRRAQLNQKLTAAGKPTI